MGWERAEWRSPEGWDQRHRAWLVACSSQGSPGSGWLQPCSTPPPWPGRGDRGALGGVVMAQGRGERLAPQRLRCRWARPGQAGELAGRDLMEPNRGRRRVLPWGGQPPAPARAGAELWGSSGKGLGVLGGSKVPAGQQCARVAEGPVGPGGHEEERGRQVEGGDPPSARPWGGRGCSAVVGAGLPSSREAGSYWRGAGGGCEDDEGTGASP